MSKIEVDQITQQSGTTVTVGGGACKTAAIDASTVTIGRSGGTVALASGASQTGFGRTGTVNWDTTKKTAGFTGVSGNGYFIDTSSGAITVNLPASPSAGDIMALADYAGTASSNNITIGRNGSNIEGLAFDAKITANRESKTLVFVDSTQGWLPVNDNFDPVADQKFVTATGGTVTETGNFKIHTFTGPGTFCVSCAGNVAGSNTVDYLVVGAGGGGGNKYAGGGGAGGYRESSGAASGCYTRSPLGACVSALPVSVQGYPITVGAGGTGAANNPEPATQTGVPGNTAVFSTVTSTGGGGGGGHTPPGPGTLQGRPGGSGGGGGNRECAAGAGNAGNGNTPSVSPPQGNNGGSGYHDAVNFAIGGGGGGATAAGRNIGVPVPCASPGSAGGAGATSSINGTPTARAGGGGGGGHPSYPNSGAPGGTGGGGTGSNGGTGTAGTANTGGGGGGGGGAPGVGGAGGSGLVIIRYKFQ